MSDPAARAEHLRLLHASPALLVLPNAWDVASARAVSDAGFPVVATSSGAVSATLGLPDGDAMPADLALSVVGRITEALDVPVTADVEAGYGLPPDELARRLISSGAVGCNYEDTDHHGDGPLLDAGLQAERIAALKAAARAEGVDIVVNARVDAVLQQLGTPDEQVEESLRRGRRYLEAGADCVYPIGLSDEDAIRRLVGELGTVNVMYREGRTPSLARLHELGVARVSLAGGLFRSLMQTLAGTLAELHTGVEGLRE